MIAVAVTFDVFEDHLEEFIEAAKINAATSLRIEAGCVRFDVVRLDGAQEVLLYENYTDEAAVEHHTQFDHYRAWREAVAVCVRPDGIVKLTGVLSC